MILDKETIKPGTYTKGRDAFVVTDSDVKEMYGSLSQIENAGYRIPLWMEHPEAHDKTARPILKTDSNLNQQVENDPYFQGWVVGGDLRNETLSLKIDVTDEMGKKLANKGTFVSPQFGKWEHGDTKISKAIHHLAITRNPVNKTQSSSFTPVHQMSMTEIDEPVRFSLGDIEDIQMSDGDDPVYAAVQHLLDHHATGKYEYHDPRKFRDAYSNLDEKQRVVVVKGLHKHGMIHPVDARKKKPLTASEVIQSATGAYKNMKDVHESIPTNRHEPFVAPWVKDKQMSDISIDQTNDLIPNSETQLSNGDVATPVDNAPQQNQGMTQASTATIQKLKQALAAMGVDVADDSPILQDVDALQKVLALLTQQMVGASKNIQDPQQQPNEQATVIAMSKEIEIANDDRIHQMSATIVKQQSMVEKLLLEATNTRKAGYLSRIDKLVKTGRCKKDKADAFRTEVGTYQFSINETDSPSILDIRLSDLEELPEGAVLSGHERVAQFAINETAVNTTSQFFTGADEVTEERAAQIMKEMYPDNQSLGTILK